MAGLHGKLWSSVGKKAIMGLSGLLLVIFVVEHLIGNLLLLSPDRTTFNTYSHKLISLGAVLIILEIGLLAVFLVHIISGISVARGKRRARPVGYIKHGNAGPPSKKNLSSTGMIYTGIILLIFVIIHLKTFKYGPHYTISVDGEEMRDLYRLVYETFARPGYVIWYVLTMALLGVHLRHGFWSAFQSLGLFHPRFTPVIYSIGIIVAVVLAVGFIVLPIWIFINPFGVTP